jgi:hypothetical protein
VGPRHVHKSQKVLSQLRRLERSPALLVVVPRGRVKALNPESLRRAFWTITTHLNL